MEWDASYNGMGRIYCAVTARSLLRHSGYEGHAESGPPLQRFRILQASSYTSSTDIASMLAGSFKTHFLPV